ncbi:MAG: DnaA/Hda family protein [Parachlamydiales bacterium]|jgi:chromosomal replication initiator protein
MQAWLDFLKKQELKIGKEGTEKWLASLKILNYDACNLYLEAENAFQVAFFEEHLRPLLKTQFLNNNFHPIRVHLALKGALPKADKTSKKPFFSKTPDFNFTSKEPEQALNFENFFFSPQTELAYRFFLELAGFSPETNSYGTPSVSAPPFNPVFLHGPKNSGKTHLLNALALRLSQAGINFFYISAQNFTEHVVEALRFGGIDQFRKKYRAIDALLVDDVQILARKTATQEEFFHTFNCLHMANKLIVLTSLFPPSKLEAIEERLVSRFQWGLPLVLEPAGTEVLFKILTQKTIEYNLKLTNEALSFLIERFPDPSNLQKALQALILRQENGQKPEIDLKTLNEKLGDLLNLQKQNHLTAETILKKTAAHFELSPADLTGKGQSQEFSFPRQIAIYFLRQKLALTYQKIGAILQRDHSTIISSFKAIEKLSLQKTENNYRHLQKMAEILETASEIE